MNKRLSVYAFLAVIGSLSFCGQNSLAADEPTTAPSLHAGVNHDETVQPSVNVLVPQEVPQNVLHGSANVPGYHPLLPTYRPLLPTYHPPFPPNHVFPIAASSGSPFCGFSVTPAHNFPTYVPHRPSYFPLNQWSPYRRPDRPLTPANGIKTWDSRYQTTVVAMPPSRIDTNIGWHSEHTSLQYAPVAPPVKPVLAVEQASPAVQANVATNWDDWYKRVGDEIYQCWRSADVKPGTATVLLTVYRTRNIDCRITDFQAAEGTTDVNDVRSRFCQSALNTINNLNQYQFWQFPPSKTKIKKVQIDIELQRRIGETPGSRVIKRTSYGR